MYFCYQNYIFDLTFKKISKKSLFLRQNSCIYEEKKIIVKKESYFKKQVEHMTIYQNYIIGMTWYIRINV